MAWEERLAAALRRHWRTLWREILQELRRKRKALLAMQAAAVGHEAFKQSVEIQVDWSLEEQRLRINLGPLLDELFNQAKGWQKTQYGKVLETRVNWEIYDQQATQWAQKYNYNLVGQITASTQRQLGRVISEWITREDDFEELVKRIRRVVPTDPYPMLRDRARVIAQTETTRVFAESRRLLFKQAGLKRMRWRTANDELVCPICAPLNGRVGRLEGINHPGEGTAYVPPAHVNCRCWLVEDVTELEELAGMEPRPRPPQPRPSPRPRPAATRRPVEPVETLTVRWSPAMTPDEAALWTEDSLLAGVPLASSLPSAYAGEDPDAIGLLRGLLDTAIEIPDLAGPGADSPWVHEFTKTSMAGKPLAEVKIKNPLVMEIDGLYTEEFEDLVDYLAHQGKNLMEHVEEHGFDSMVLVSSSDHTVLTVYVSQPDQFTYLKTADGKALKNGMTYGEQTWMAKGVRLEPNFEPGMSLEKVKPIAPPTAELPRAAPPAPGEEVATVADDRTPPRRVIRRPASPEEAVQQPPGSYATLEEASGGPFQEVLEPLDIDHELIRKVDLHAADPGNPWGAKTPGRKTSYGVVLVDSYGRILLREPTDHFGGYSWTFAKGTPDPGEHPLDAALREVKEETGFDVQVIGLLPGKHSSADSDTFFFVARPTAFDANAIDWETASTRWVTLTEAEELIKTSPNLKGRQRDLGVLTATISFFSSHQTYTEWLLKMVSLAGQVSGVADEPPVDVAKLQRIRSLGGSHAVYLMEAEDGSRWVWKPQERWRAQVDRTTYEIAAALGHEIPETYVVTIGGRVGSLQRFYEGGILSNQRAADLTREQTVQLQKEAIFDWLISNHDGHEGNILVMPDGRIVGIDKGQAFKFFGRDRLDWDYNPNRNFGVVSWHNRTLRRFAQGESVWLADPAKHPELREFIRRIERLPEAQVRRILKPYIEAMQEARILPMGDPERFIQAFLERKDNIGKDFADLYRRARKARAAALGERYVEEPEVIVPLAEVVEDVLRAGWQGKTLMMGGADIEDMAVLISQIEDDGALFEFKLRPQAQERLLAALIDETTGKSWAEVLSQRVRQDVRAGTAAVHDPYYDKVKTVAKSFNYHFVPTSPGYDGKFPGHTANAINQLHQTLTAAAAAGDKAAQHHLPTIRRLYDLLHGRLDTARYAGKIWVDQYEPKPERRRRGRKPAPAQEPIRGVRAESGNQIETPAVTNREGRLYRGKRPQRRKGVSLQFELAPGIRAIYVPHGDNLNRGQYSKQGKMWIETERPADEETIEEVRQALERLNINTRLATREDLEYMYLIKTTYAALGSVEEAGVNLATDTQQQVISKLKEFWQERLGVERLEDLPTWRPEPIFESPAPSTGVREGRFGLPKWRRFDVSEEDIARLRDELRLVHTLSSRDPVDFLEMALANNGALISTEEKFRIGISVNRSSGLSPEEDQRTGGASYTFTRIRAKDLAASSTYHLVFDPELLAMTDVITYSHDLFGRARPEHIRMHRKRTPEDWLRIARRRSHGNYGEETNIKGRISLLDWLDAVNVRTTSQRQRLIKLFKRYGIETIRGRPIEEVIRVV